MSCHESQQSLINQPKRRRREENTRCRTVEIHERVERPVLGVVTVGVIVRPTKREGPEMRPLRQF